MSHQTNYQLFEAPRKATCGIRVQANGNVGKRRIWLHAVARLSSPLLSRGLDQFGEEPSKGMRCQRHQINKVQWPLKTAFSTLAWQPRRQVYRRI